MRVERGVQPPEAEPLQLLPRVRAAGAPPGSHQQQRPPAAPRLRTLAVDAPGGLREALGAAARQAVLAAAPGAARREPPLPPEPRDRGAHQALRETEGRGQADEAAEGGRRTARRDGVAEDRDEERP